MYNDRCRITIAAELEAALLLGAVVQRFSAFHPPSLPVRLRYNQTLLSSFLVSSPLDIVVLPFPSIHFQTKTLTSISEMTAETY